MRIMTMLISIMVVANSLAANSDTPEGLAELFIGAINAKSAENQRALIHPQCLVGLSGLQKDFMDEALSKDFRRTIPEKRTVKITTLEGQELPFFGAMVWPVKPTHQIAIEFSTGENATTSVIRFVAKEKDQWFIVMPMLSPETLKKYEDRKSSQQGAPLPSAPQRVPSEEAR